MSFNRNREPTFHSQEMVFGTRVLWSGAKKVASSAAAKSDKPTFLIVTSIGNPDKDYAGSRHNTGKLLLQMTRHKFFPHPKLRGVEYAVDLERPNVLYLQTLNYMNVCGVVVKPAWHLFSRLKSIDYNVQYAVVHDELSKDLGEVQLRSGKASPRGHNGLKNISKMCHVDYHRIGIGIGRPESRDPYDVADYVLGVQSRHERQTLEQESFPKMMKIIDDLRNS